MYYCLAAPPAAAAPAAPAARRASSFLFVVSVPPPTLWGRVTGGAVSAQRLVRRRCSSAGEPRAAGDGGLSRLGYCSSCLIKTNAFFCSVLGNGWGSWATPRFGNCTVTTCWKLVNSDCTYGSLKIQIVHMLLVICQLWWLPGVVLS